MHLRNDSPLIIYKDDSGFKLSCDYGSRHVENVHSELIDDFPNIVGICAVNGNPTMEKHIFYTEELSKRIVLTLNLGYMWDIDNLILDVMSDQRKKLNVDVAHIKDRSSMIDYHKSRIRERSFQGDKLPERALRFYGDLLGKLKEKRIFNKI